MSDAAAANPLRNPSTWLAAGVAALALLSAAGASAAAPLPPSVITGPLTSVTPSSATVSGSVNPNGLATTWDVEYGTTTSYGSKSASVSAGSGTSSANISATLGSLSAGTTYHYRFVATSSGGTGQGGDALLSTPAAPGVVTGDPTSVSATGANLNGTVDPNGRTTTWYFEYGTSTSYGTKTAVQNAGNASTAVNVSAAVGGLKTGKLYHYRLVATSDAGTSHATDKTVTTVAVPTVTSGAASSISVSGAKLNGSVNPNGHTTSYYFEYGTTTNYGTKTSGKSAGSGTSTTNVSETLTGLAAATTYHFHLVASNGSGTSTGADQTFATIGPPIAQTGQSQAVTTTTATVTGTVYPRGVSTSWYFEYGTTTKYGTKTSTKSAGSSATSGEAVSANLANLTAGTAYHYRVVATSSSGTSDGSDLTFTTPQAVTITAPTTKVIFGNFVTVGGTVSGGPVGVTVTILAEPFGSGSLAPVATVLTGAGGAWTYRAKPTILTTYQASVTGGSSSTVMVGVQPALSLHRITGNRLATVAVASKSFAGRSVQLQRLSHGRWVTVKRTELNSRSAAIFLGKALPHGTSTIRIAMSVNAAGPGYLASFSRTILYHRG